MDNTMMTPGLLVRFEARGWPPGHGLGQPLSSLRNMLPGEAGNTVLFKAPFVGIDALRHCLDAGVDMEVVGHGGQTALLMLVSTYPRDRPAHWRESIECLIERGARLDDTTLPGGRTLLMVALYMSINQDNEDPWLVRALVRKGGPVLLTHRNARGHDAWGYAQGSAVLKDAIQEELALHEATRLDNRFSRPDSGGSPPQRMRL